MIAHASSETTTMMKTNLVMKSRRSERSHLATSTERRIRHSPVGTLPSRWDWQAVGSVWSVNFSYTAELKATRKPRLLFRFDGSFLLRFADRQFLAELFQLPPRFTRFEPFDRRRHTF